jgi:hypothetical protein
MMDALQKSQVDSALPCDIKVGKTQEGYIVIQSMGNDVVAPNFLVLTRETAKEIARQILSIM